MSTFPEPPTRQSSWLSTIAEEPEDHTPVKPPRSHEQSEFTELLDYLCTPIVPLVSCTTGRICPDFPKNILAYLLLTSTQLDTLARHYHQVWPPIPETYIYPTQILPWIGTPAHASIDLETKRCRFGLFIGLGGYESLREAALVDELSPMQSEAETEARILEFMEKEWQEALLRARREECWGFVGK